MCVCLRVLCELVEVIVHVEGICLSQVHKFLQSFVDENDADEWSEGFLCEASDVAHQGTGVCGHQGQAEESRPQPDTHT